MFLCKFNILHTGGASPSPTTENLNFVRRRHFKQKLTIRFTVLGLFLKKAWVSLFMPYFSLDKWEFLCYYDKEHIDDDDWMPSVPWRTAAFI